MRQRGDLKICRLSANHNSREYYMKLRIDKTKAKPATVPRHRLLKGVLFIGYELANTIAFFITGRVKRTVRRRRPRAVPVQPLLSIHIDLRSG